MINKDNFNPLIRIRVYLRRILKEIWNRNKFMTKLELK